MGDFGKLFGAILLSCLQSVAIAQTEKAASVIGIMPLPEVYGAGPCQRFVPQPVPLFSEPAGRVIGEVRVARHWSFAPEGGCEGLSVVAEVVRPRPDSAPLPVLEYEYEQPGAIVIGQDGNWFQIALDKGSAWIRPMHPEQFRTVEKLLGEWVYLTKDADPVLYPRPDPHADPFPLATRNAKPPSASVRSFQRVAGSLWVQVETLKKNPCADDGAVFEKQTGWLPFYGRGRRPAIWFYPRGC